MFPLSPVILACIDLHLIPVLQRDKQTWRQVEQTCHPGDQGNPLGTKPCDKTKLQSCQNISLGYPWRTAVFVGPWEVFFLSWALRSSYSLSRANGNSFVIFINYLNFWPLLNFIFKKKKRRGDPPPSPPKPTNYNAEIGLWLKVVARVVLKQVQLLDFNGNVYASLEKAVVMGGCIWKQFLALKKQVCKQDLCADVSSWDDLS